ncbi:CRE-ATG-4.2 protein [Caenorhabditis remanei]|uniref:Cysteine protease n=2 Tax=Caenorhabditis remanei TaxID=31234 RepID=E3M7W6_CAERE|nr:CRE-ATG-4.2 protein [Caenorhabditis remanei]
MSNPSEEDFEKVPSTSQPNPKYCSSESSLSDDEREQIEHVLKHGAPSEALTPDSERMVVLGEDMVHSAPGSLVPTGNSSWINRIKTAGASMMGSIRPSSSSQEAIGETERHPKKKWKARLWSTWNNIKYSSTWMSDRTDEYGGEDDVVFLGRRYSTNKDANGVSSGFEDFCSDYYSRLWITYRTDFAPLLNTDTTTDCGWGCMIRTTQMMVAQAIMLNRFGREWRFVRRKKSYVTINGEETDFDREKIKEWMILKLFEDKPSSPLGIHRMVEISAKEKGKKAVGSWYSPSEAVFIMKKALTESISPLTGDTAMYLSIDGRVHIRDIEVETKNWMKTLILVIVVRLGAAELNPIYVPHLMRLFSMESCLGVTGGRPDHSCWFVGFYGDQIIYLDPHVAHEYIPIDMNFNVNMTDNKKSKKCPERSYHCRLLSKMHFLDMDPSCALCFRFESREQFDHDMRQLNLSQFIDIDQGEEHGMKRVRDPLFSVVYGERRRIPSYEREVSESDLQQADKHGFEML